MFPATSGSTQQYSTHDLDKLDRYKTVKTGASKPFLKYYRKFQCHPNREWITMGQKSPDSNARDSLISCIYKWMNTTKPYPNYAKGDIDVAIRMMLVDPPQVVFDVKSGADPFMNFFPLMCHFCVDNHLTPEMFIDNTVGDSGIMKCHTHVEYDIITFTFNMHFDKENDCVHEPVITKPHNWRRLFITFYIVNFLLFKNENSTYLIK